MDTLTAASELKQALVRLHRVEQAERMVNADRSLMHDLGGDLNTLKHRELEVSRNLTNLFADLGQGSVNEIAGRRASAAEYQQRALRRLTRVEQLCADVRALLGGSDDSSG